ncbi:DUF5713 family protein [Streptomyces canus]|uniref:DUF5713 family protein n=1 Tax=Streptomyces canus TaxID=58343 RepID=UPI003674B731
MNISDQRVRAHAFLDALYRDGWYPDRAVDRGKEILLRLCARIEAERPVDLAALYVLTQAATEEFNALQDEEFDIETVAREEIAEEFWFIARTYGFETADVEELIATRDW